MTKENDEMIQKLKASLKSALKSHDWYFAFSDDRRAYDFKKTKGAK